MLGLIGSLPPHVAEYQELKAAVPKMQVSQLQNLWSELNGEWFSLEAWKKEGRNSNEIRQANVRISHLKMMMSLVSIRLRKLGSPPATLMPSGKVKQPVYKPHEKAPPGAIIDYSQGVRPKPPSATEQWSSYAACLKNQQRGAKIKCTRPGGLAPSSFHQTMCDHPGKRYNIVTKDCGCVVDRKRRPSYMKLDPNTCTWVDTRQAVPAAPPPVEPVAFEPPEWLQYQFEVPDFEMPAIPDFGASQIEARIAEQRAELERMQAQGGAPQPSMPMYALTPESIALEESEAPTGVQIAAEVTPADDKEKKKKVAIAAGILGAALLLL